MSELAKGVSKLICVVKVKAGEDGKMFGSVTAGMIADELKHQFDITLDKKKIHLEHAIKTLGEHEVELHLHAEVKSTLESARGKPDAGHRACRRSGACRSARRKNAASASRTKKLKRPKPPGRKAQSCQSRKTGESCTKAEKKAKAE